MSNKILVLGPTGNVGAPLVQMLKRSNTNFILGIQPDIKVPGFMKDFPSILVDYNIPLSIDAAMTDADSLFVLIPDSPRMVDHATNIKNAILKNNVFRYIYLSGAGVTLAPETWLSKNLYKCEEILSSSGIQGIILRPTFFMQNFLNHYPPNSARQIRLPIGEGKINYIDVNDVAFVVHKLLTADVETNGRKVFHLTGDVSLDMHEIVKLFSDSLKASYTYIPTSLEETKTEMEKDKRPDWLVSMLSQIYEKVRENRYAHSTNDFQTLTGKRPNDFASFIQNNKTHFGPIEN